MLPATCRLPHGRSMWVFSIVQAHCHLSGMQSNNGYLLQPHACQSSEPWEEDWRLLLSMSTPLYLDSTLSLPVGLHVNTGLLFSRHKVWESVHTWLCSRSSYGVWSSSTSFSRHSLFQKSVSPFGYLVCQTCVGINDQFSTVKYILLLLLKFCKTHPNLPLSLTSQLLSLGSGKMRCPAVLRSLMVLLTVPVIIAAVKVLFHFRYMNLSCSEYMHNTCTLQGSTWFSCGK